MCVIGIDRFQTLFAFVLDVLLNFLTYWFCSLVCKAKTFLSVLFEKFGIITRRPFYISVNAHEAIMMMQRSSAYIMHTLTSASAYFNLDNDTYTKTKQ